MIEPVHVNSKNNSDPLIVYVHPPKTGGTAINKMLKLRSYRGRAHCEWASDATFHDIARHGDWLAGHISQDEFAVKLRSDRKKEYISSVREPVSQVISLLNWYFEIHDRGDLEANSQTAVEVRGVDYSNTASVTSFLLKNKWFLNQQSRFILGGDFANISQAETTRRLLIYTYISTEHNSAKLFRAFYFANMPEFADTWRENVAKPHFDYRFFQTHEMREFFDRHHAHDLRLYNIVKNLRWPSRRHCRFRPLRFQCKIATPENFVEQDYLDANPDIADAIQIGHFVSGRQHFDLYGHSQGRLMVASELKRVFARRAIILLSAVFRR
jgi:hypothetical protein